MAFLAFFLSIFLTVPVLFRHLNLLHMTQRKGSSFLVPGLILVTLSETWRFPFFASDRFKDWQISLRISWLSCFQPVDEAMHRQSARRVTEDFWSSDLCLEPAVIGGLPLIYDNGYTFPYCWSQFAFGISVTSGWKMPSDASLDTLHCERWFNKS